MATKITINVRTDIAIKKSAQRAFRKMGLDLSTGVNMYLARVAQDQAMPFVGRTINGFTPAFEAQILREAEHARKYAKRYKTVEEAIRAIS